MIFFLIYTGQVEKIIRNGRGERNAGDSTRRQKALTEENFRVSLSFGCNYSLCEHLAIRGDEKWVQFCLKMKELISANKQQEESKLLKLRKGKNTVSNEAAFSMLLSHFD